MSDALPLPPRPNVEQYKKLAKDFQRACKSSDSGAVRGWAVHWVETIARLQGEEITPNARRRLDVEAERIEHRWNKLKEKRELAGRCTLADAQLFVAREHGFASWPKFAGHLQALARAHSAVSQFEAAAEAIVRGEFATLEKLLKENPALVRARSMREHRSTLLHYAAANGVEDFRQKTPHNIVEITKLLLAAGADVNAESDAYGGRSTTLGLAATSCHPENAGVQFPLMELLIDYGAIINGPDAGSTVNACLHNGRRQAAEFLANRGARLDLEGAAGVGRLDLVKSFFNDDGSLRPPATEKQVRDGFAWACEFGRNGVVDFLLRRGVAIGAKLSHDGQTGLHWAALGGHADTVKLLLERGVRVDARDERYDGTPLGWALYAWNTRAKAAERERYYEVVAVLVRAGAKPPVFAGADRVASDPRMQAALRGEIAAE
ncbi:MAG: ankyrin repeat domain-containing protein [Acidobacteriaceae bacterium]|nr:ankyrin repeat domain-containing protein [Acidobacteriaceae bacterium]